MSGNDPLERAAFALWTQQGAARDYLAIFLLGMALWVVLVASNAFYSSVIAVILIWTIGISGLNIIAGLGGYPSLMQGAFYGIGAYGAALALEWRQPFWLACMEAVVAAGGLALVIGLMLSRSRGQYFAIGTMFT